MAAAKSTVLRQVVVRDLALGACHGGGDGLAHLCRVEAARAPAGRRRRLPRWMRAARSTSASVTTPSTPLPCSRSASRPSAWARRRAAGLTAVRAGAARRPGAGRALGCSGRRQRGRRVRGRRQRAGGRCCCGWYSGCHRHGRRQLRRAAHTGQHRADRQVLAQRRQARRSRRRGNTRRRSRPCGSRPRRPRRPTSPGRRAAPAIRRPCRSPCRRPAPAS